jgi:predicted extracellular nuclease
MKKTLLFVSLFVASASFAQDCSELFISEYVEGSGNDKAIEIYNPTGQPINLSGYSIARYSNGESFIAAGAETALTGVIESNSTFVLVNGQTTTQGTSPACSPALQLLADQLDNAHPAPTYMNGNDAIVLFKNGVAIDHFGKTGQSEMQGSQAWSDEFPYDGSAGTRWTKDHSLQRKATVLKGVATNPDVFIVTTEWDSLPKDTWTNLGMHTCNCFASINKINSNEFSVYPNPSNSKVYLKSVSTFTSVSLVNVLGQEVLTLNNLNTNAATLNVANLEKGIYVVRIKNSDATISNKQIVVE